MSYLLLLLPRSAYFPPPYAGNPYNVWAFTESGASLTAVLLALIVLGQQLRLRVFESRSLLLLALAALTFFLNWSFLVACELR